MSLPIIQTIQNNISNLKSTKTDIKNAVNTDYDFINNEQIESYPNLIKQGIAHYKNRIPHAIKEGTDLSFNSIPLKFDNMTIKGNTEQTTSILPDTYTQVDYIESAGAGYIDSGVNADSNLSLEMDYQFTDISNQDKIYLGAIYNPSGTNYTRYHTALSSENLRFILRGVGTDVGTIDTSKHKWFVSQEKFIYDGTEIMRTDTVAFDTTINFWLMGRNANTESLKKYAYMKLYRCKMWYSNALVRDFIPCYRNSDNELGLYDTVNDVFYPNQGTGTFTYGTVAAIPNPDYPQDIHVVTGENTIIVDDTTYPINLGNIELCKIGEYQDYLYKENGNWYKYGVIEKIVLNGVETWRTNIVSSSVKTIRFARDFHSLVQAAYSDKMYVRIGGAHTDTEYIMFGNTILYFNINQNRLSENSVDAFKDFLTNNNIINYHILETPAIIQIIDGTLISQLNAIDKAKGNNGTTIITSNGDDLAPILNFTAYLKEVE